MAQDKVHLDASVQSHENTAMVGIFIDRVKTPAAAAKKFIGKIFAATSDMNEAQITQIGDQIFEKSGDNTDLWGNQGFGVDAFVYEKEDANTVLSALKTSNVELNLNGEKSTVQNMEAVIHQAIGKSNG